MEKTVDVAILGAGSAGLSALKEVQKMTENYVVIQDGPLGTTCARVGCMPSRVMIQIANQFHHRGHLSQYGIAGGKALKIDLKKALRHVRTMRDGFVEGVLEATDRIGDKRILGRATFEGPNHLRVGSQGIRAERVIVATGSTPAIPKEFAGLSKNQLLTTDCSLS